MPEIALASDSEYAVCRSSIRHGSKTFFAASKLLPGPLRDPAYALYAFCRNADDVIDIEAQSIDGLNRLRDRLERAYAGAPLPLAIDRAFADTVARHAIPKALPLALLEGLEWDTQGRRYRTFSDLLAYGARVAGAVGAMMTVLMGRRDAETVARACDLGVAMQLTNIARDIGEDARNGRVYLPDVWLDEVGVCRQHLLQAPQHDRALARLVERLLAEAAQLYRRATPGIAALPLGCRPGIYAARYLYAEIGHEVARNACNAIDQRAVVNRRRKIAGLLTAVAAVLAAPRTAFDVQALPETHFLIEAVTGEPVPHHLCVPSVPEEPPLAGVALMLEMFHRLEQREHMARAMQRT
ncbi:MAG: phytoene/squalene synthase family protein [Geminicoccaceae bacterium]